MSSVVLAGSSSGTLTIAAPAAAGTNTITLPAETGTILTSATQAGNILQVVETSYKTAVAFNLSAFGATGVTASITPSSSSNKVLVMVKLDIGSSNSGNAEGAKTRLYRDGSNLTGAMGANASSRIGSFITHPCYTGDESSFMTHYGQFLDSPSTTSSTEYKIYIRGYDASGSYPVYLNRSHSDSDNASVPRGVCVMTLMEVAG